MQCILKRAHSLQAHRSSSRTLSAMPFITPSCHLKSVVAYFFILLFHPMLTWMLKKIFPFLVVIHNLKRINEAIEFPKLL